MNFSMIRYILAWVLTFNGTFLLLPSFVSLLYQENEGWVYLCVAAACLLLGTLGRLKKPSSKVFYSKEGFVCVSLSWILLSLVGALPFTLTGEIPSYVDAVFETISGFTTTGSSILTDVEALSHTALFWRSFTHWVGGMGVLVFIMAILPLAGGANMHLMRAESPGPTVGKLVPKVKRTAMILYGIYLTITVAEVIALLLAGMNMFDSLTLTFGTVGTGGFGILNTSAMTYSTAVQNIITIFMLLCSVNFIVYYLLITKKWKEACLYDELRYFLVIVFASGILIAFNIKDIVGGFGKAFQTSMFQVATVVSTTGYATADFNLWPTFSKVILVMLMFMGACAGSTGGGFKVSRLIILLKAAKNEVQAIVHPRSVQKIYSNGKVVSNETVKKVLAYLAAYVLIFITSVILVSLDGKDMTTTFTSVIATFNNIGPGLEIVGPTGNFSSFSIFAKIVLMLDMLIGRLEILPMLVILAPGTWRLKNAKSNKNNK